MDRRCDDPEQFRAIGSVSGTLYSVIYEVRQDADGEFYHLVTLWKATEKEERLMPNTPTKPVDADEIADMADRGQDISRHFTNRFTVARPPIQRVNVDFAAAMLGELDREAEMLNISRQAVIKTMLREALDRRYLAQRSRQAS